jgi:hypothetical protein
MEQCVNNGHGYDTIRASPNVKTDTHNGNNPTAEPMHNTMDNTMRTFAAGIIAPYTMANAGPGYINPAAVSR